MKFGVRTELKARLIINIIISSLTGKVARRLEKMTLPRTVIEQVKDSYFVPDHKLVVYFAATIFDAVHRDFHVANHEKFEESKESVQFYADLTKKDQNGKI